MFNIFNATQLMHNDAINNRPPSFDWDTFVPFNINSINFLLDLPLTIDNTPLPVNDLQLDIFNDVTCKQFREIDTNKRSLHPIQCERSIDFKYVLLSNNRIILFGVHPIDSLTFNRSNCIDEDEEVEEVDL